MKGRNARIFLLATTAIAQLVIASSSASAQGASKQNQSVDTDHSEYSAEDIIITGTQVRGSAPTGSPVVTVSADDIVSSGATNTNEVLSHVPIISNFFNNKPSTPGGTLSGAVQIVTPSIRGLPTLILMDGHRLTEAGTFITGVDPGILPSGVLERVEIVPDGGSSVYGSDAVGGVINFISKRRFNGFAVNARYGVADDYRSQDVDASAGKDWGSGSAYISYTYSWHNEILGADRDYIYQITPSTVCSPGTVTANGVRYRLPDRQPNTTASCDDTNVSTYIPRESRHSIYAGLTQELSSSISIDLRAFYTHRSSLNFNPQQSSTVTIANTNPFFVPIGSETSQSVNYTYGSVFGNASATPTRLDEWGASANTTADLGSGFQLRFTGDYSRAASYGENARLNLAAESAAVAATTLQDALNPYDLTRTSATVLAKIRDNVLVYGAKAELMNARVVIDGPLASLPGGELKIAAGSEYLLQTFAPYTGNRTAGAFTSFQSANGTRRDIAAFGELSVPIFSSTNGFAGMRSLLLSLSARYDSYNDFGDTFNPRIALNYRPVEWFMLRGNWSKSFVAPPLAWSQGIRTAQINPPGSFFNFLQLAPGGNILDAITRPSITLAGGNPSLRPQKATIWSVGFDIDPPVVPGLRISGTYYNVKYRDRIATAPFFAAALLYSPAYVRFTTLNPTLAQALAATGGMTVDGAPSIASLYANPAQTPFVMVDAREQNLAQVQQTGADLDVNFRTPTAFGSINASIGGTYILVQKSSAAPGLPFSDTARYGLSRLSLVASAGFDAGRVHGNTALNYSAGYDLTPGSVPNQSRVRAFKSLDLYLAYDLAKEGVLASTSLTVNVNNLLDENPPPFNAGNGISGGNVLGRYVQFGIRTKF